ncbi:MAG: hypothetical protein FJX74_03560 [Armatimonadetes bacterium]|nr:hypothetical protein [Armatimonadota bacterium]
MSSRVCPHCGATNPDSAIITLCRRCGGSLESTALPPAVPRGVWLSGSAPTPPSPPPPPLPVPRPPWERAALPDDLGTAEASEPAVDMPPPPGLGLASPYADWPLRLPIWLHLTLDIIVTMASFLGFPMLVATRGEAFVPQWCPAPVAFLGSAVVALLTMRLLFGHVVLGRCPRCGGGAKMRTGRPITYHCQACGHVHRSKVSGG